MKTGLVVLNYNDSETVINFLDKVRGYNSIDRIVVVDNCSTDGAYERISSAIGAEKPVNGTEISEPDKIDLIRADRNRGYAAGNNLGVRHLVKKYEPDFCVIANPDVFFTEDTLKKVISHLEAIPDAGLVSCRMNCLSSISMPTAWKLPRYKDCLFQDSFIIKKIFGDSTEYPDSHFDSDISRVDVVQGSFFAFRPEVFNEVGGFDEHTFLYYEENILAHRLKSAGKSSYVVNTCEYDHYHSVSINKSIDSVKKRLDIAYRSRLWYCREYLHVNRFQELLLEVFHRIGVRNYLIYKRVKGDG